MKYYLKLKEALSISMETEAVIAIVAPIFLLVVLLTLGGRL